MLAALTPFNLEVVQRLSNVCVQVMKCALESVKGAINSRVVVGLSTSRVGGESRAERCGKAAAGIGPFSKSKGGIFPHVLYSSVLAQVLQLGEVSLLHKSPCDIPQQCALWQTLRRINDVVSKVVHAVPL